MEESKVQESYSDGEEIYYFGYGPIVHPMVRRRRKVETYDERAVVLPEHRLTFNFGGVANLVPQRGYEVHGVLMKFKSKGEWLKFQEYDPGYNEPDEVKVYRYDAPEEEPITAYTMVMKCFDEMKLDRPIQNLPVERYLKLISGGLRHYGADEDYIEDQILSVPYIPAKAPEEYDTFPQASNPLPTITMAAYKKLAQRSSDLYFIMNQNVVRLGPHDPGSPAAVWLRERMHGKGEGTLIVHQTIVEPGLPIADREEDLTPLHHGWAEDHSVQFFKQCGLSATKVYQIVSEEEFRSSRRRRPSGFQASSQVRRVFRFLRVRRGTTATTTATSSNDADNMSPRSDRHRLGAHVSGFFSSEFMQREIRGTDHDGGFTDDESDS